MQQDHRIAVAGNGLMLQRAVCAIAQYGNFDEHRMIALCNCLPRASASGPNAPARMQRHSSATMPIATQRQAKPQQ